MAAIEPWEKAADCERSAQASIDPHLKVILHRLRDLWIALGNERALMREADLAAKVEAINRMQLHLTRAA